MKKKTKGDEQQHGRTRKKGLIRWGAQMQARTSKLDCGK
jgi:hypothetical protein